MSQEPRAQPNGEPCPACGAAAPPGILNRPPLELRFCGSCGMLLGAQVLRDRAGIEPEKLPTPLFSVSLKSPPEQRSPLVAAPAGGPRALTPPPPPVESQLRPPPAPGTAPPAAGPPPPPPSVSVVPGQVAPPPAPAAPAAVAGASVDLQPFLRTLTPSRLKAPHPPGAAAPRPSHPPLGADRSAVAPATASTPLPTLEPGF
ncbi:MAG: hypothetical protein FJ125_08105, partial [Deltaproteobacteria bacterium]|nr:hypothetical protein [Deltaproteobacteria bacterium]